MQSRRPKASPATQNASRKSSGRTGGENREVRGQRNALKLTKSIFLILNFSGNDTAGPQVKKWGGTEWGERTEGEERLHRGCQGDRFICM